MTSCYAQSLQNAKVTYDFTFYDKVVLRVLTGTHPVTFSYIEISAENIDRKNFRVNGFNYRLMMHETDNLARWQSREKAVEYFSEEYIAKAERMVRTNVRNMRGLIEKGKMHPAFQAMENQVKRVVKSYLEDFYWHDLLTLGNFNPDKFIWCVRECGTNLYLAKSAYDWAKYYVEGNSGGVVEFYAWDGDAFYKMGLNEVLQDIETWLPDDSIYMKEDTWKVAKIAS